MLEITSCESRVLADNPLGDSHTREVGVYLPPSYDGRKRFPLVIFLPGFTGTGLQLLNRGAWQQPIDRRLETLFRDGRAREAGL